MKGLIKKLLRESTELESLLNEIDANLDLSSFKMKSELNPKIWVSDDKINPKIKDRLIKIATEYWESLDLNFPFLGITMTGSLSNYNWSQYSDVDLHIVFDDNRLGDDKLFVKDLLDVKTRTWNTRHNIKMKGFEVEIYLQPKEQEHFSTGIYSLSKDKWLIKPDKQVVKLDKANIRKKYNEIVKRVDDIERMIERGRKYKTASKRIDKLKEKIRNMRKGGLETGGEYSVENIVFKSLRRNDIMDKLGDMSEKAYDSSMTIKEAKGL